MKQTFWENEPLNAERSSIHPWADMSWWLLFFRHRSELTPIWSGRRDGSNYFQCRLSDPTCCKAFRYISSVHSMCSWPHAAAAIWMHVRGLRSARHFCCRTWYLPGLCRTALLAVRKAFKVIYSVEITCIFVLFVHFFETELCCVFRPCFTNLVTKGGRYIHYLRGLLFISVSFSPLQRSTASQASVSSMPSGATICIRMVCKIAEWYWCGVEHGSSGGK